VTPQATNREEGNAPVVAVASTSHVERAREPGVKYAPLPPGIHKKVAINRCLPTFVDTKIAENAVFQ
jgi:hypothetical protein